MSKPGYQGKILKLDLSSREERVDTPDEKFYRLYCGPGLIGSHYLLRQTRAGLDAFSPANVLTFANGVAGGNLGPAMARFAAVAKSPLSEGVFESRCEGPFARALKGSGYDAIVLQGKAERPGYLLIDGGNWSLLDAAGLWGKTTSETQQALELELGSDIAVACIGPAGEKQCRFSGIVAARAHQTQRGGLGAVMGSKNLKAVVIRNPCYPEPADPDALARLDRLFREEGITKNTLNVWQKEPPGFSHWLDVVVDPGYVSSRNAQAHDYQPPPSFTKQEYSQYLRHTSACPGCANDCIKTFNTRNLTGDDWAGGMNWEVIASLAINLDLENLETYFDLNTVCLLYGLDPISLGNVLGFAAECAEKGVLGRDDFGFDFGFGKAADANAVRLAEMIAQRKGIGDVLAEGVRRAAATIGKAAEPFALHVKGVEMGCIEPRCQTNLALGFAMAANGPQGDICEHDWDYDTTVGWDHTLERSRTLGILERIPMAELSAKKVYNYKTLNAVWSGTDGVGLCLYACAPTRYFRMAQIAELVAAATGWDFSSYELMRIGERRNALMRWYNYREGFRAAQDTLPERYYTEPIKTGRHQGRVIHRERFRQMIGVYYAMAGWDAEGRPTAVKLYELGLDEQAAESARQASPDISQGVGCEA